MTNLFNDNWQFCEIALNEPSMYKDGNPVIFEPGDFYNQANNSDLQYTPVCVPHDWQIFHVKDLYKNSVGCYKKIFILDDIKDSHFSVRFEGVYMNSQVWVNGKSAGQWKYGYGTFEYDISDLVQEGENLIQVIAVYQNCNTRWYSGAGIFRDVSFTKTGKTFLTPDGTYFRARKTEGSKWDCKFSAEVCGEIAGHKVRHIITDKNGVIFEKTQGSVPLEISSDENEYLNKVAIGIKNQKICRAEECFSVESPELWDIENPFLYKVTTELIDSTGTVIDSIEQNFGFKTAVFDKEKGFFLNGRHVKIYGACHHHDQGALGAAFNKNAFRRQLNKLKEMGVNSVRCSHNPPPKGWMDLCDEMGILVDDEAFDMWEKPKTPFDYGNHFNDWCEKDTASWVRKDRNHPCLIMWSIGNEIYDTHMGNGLEITKKLKSYVNYHDPDKNALVTIASNYMMTDGAQECAKEIETVGYNYLERLYDEHYKKYKNLPDWKIYGSETGSTIQSRGIYHFPETLKLVTFSDMQCSCLGNCTTTWGAANTQTVVATDRDCSFSAGQYIWTGWDYIGEPTPYHSKNSFFGQIDTAGFPKDTFYLYKSEWAYKNTAPFVHLLPYWDWNEGQIIDVKAYSNAESVELFFNGKSLGKHEIDHKAGKSPFGQWQLEYHKGEITAVGYDENGKEICRETKRSFEDPAKILLIPETEDTGNLFFVQIMTEDKNQTLVENARNNITIKVDGDGELVGLDNGDSTDFDEYFADNKKIHTRKLFQNRLIAIIRGKTKNSSFTVSATSKDLPVSSIEYDGLVWCKNQEKVVLNPEKDFVPDRKIEISCYGTTELSKENKEVFVTAKVLPENASIKTIQWNPVLKECVSSDYIEVHNLQGKGTGVETATIKAMCDGECILRLCAQNGQDHDEILSDLNFTVSGVGNPKLNPYKMIEACRLSKWDPSKEKPVVSLESGISNRGLGPTWISFDKVDFGTEGADTIHLPIFSFDTELPVEVWDGIPEELGDGKKGRCLLQATYKHSSIYNTFSENVFTLPRRLFGVHTISIVFKTELVFHGFYFDQTAKAFSKLNALDADAVVGDSFTKAEDAVIGIGNNVNLDFSNMDFGNKGATKLTICGKSNTENNTINLKLFGENGTVRTHIIEFENTKDYEEKTFDLEEITGLQKVSFVFLPGCNFDFRWFRFSC